MDTNYYAATIVGCRIDRGKLFFTKNVRSCGCAAQEAKYCQECGQKWWCKVDVAHPQYNYGTGRLCDLEVFDSNFSDHVFIAATSSHVDKETYVSEEKIDAHLIISGQLRGAIKKVLEPLDMWEKGNNFGIWTIMWCDYDASEMFTDCKDSG
jgi:hypothetical protein